MMRPLVVSGSAHASLAEDLARELECEFGTSALGRFPDGEQDVEIQASVRGLPVFVVQPLGPPVGENLLELLLIADACRRAGAATVAAVIPYVGFARQDRVVKEGRPLGAKVLADALGTGGFSQVLAVDLHSAVVASCVQAPVAHLTAVPLLVEPLRSLVRPDSVVVAPDLGAVKLAEEYARLLGLPLAVVSKARISPVEVEARSVVGDVRGRRPLIVDDMISTGATVDVAIAALLAQGCEPDVMVAATHGLFVESAADRLSRSEVVRTITSDSLPVPPRRPARLDVVRLAPLLAEAIRRIVGGRGLDELLATR
jgi:ribose-phosphate pyrophosphokinase